MLSSAFQSGLVRTPHLAGDLVWRRFGAGFPVVLMHGGHGSWRHWQRNIAALETRHEVWVADLPGFGDSDPPCEPTREALVAAVGAGLDVIFGREQPLALVGFSFGGLVAAEVAAVRRGVSLLGLVGAGGHGGVRRPRGELLKWRAAHDDGDAPELAAIMRHNLALHMVGDASLIDDEAVEIHTRSCLQTRFRSKDVVQPRSLQSALSRYHGPTLLVWGEHDVTAEPATLLPQLAAGRRDCTAHIVPTAGHWVQYEAAAIFDAHLSQALAVHAVAETVTRRPLVG